MKGETLKIRRGLYKHKGYELQLFGYHHPDHCVLREAVNSETQNADFHAHTKKELIWLIDEYDEEATT